MSLPAQLSLVIPIRYFFSFPAPFPCRFVPRHPEVLSVAAQVREATLNAHLAS